MCTFIYGDAEQHAPPHPVTRSLGVMKKRLYALHDDPDVIRQFSLGLFERLTRPNGQPRVY